MASHELGNQISFTAYRPDVTLKFNFYPNDPPPPDIPLGPTFGTIDPIQLEHISNKGWEPRSICQLRVPIK
jgi:hypothetical protein